MFRTRGTNKADILNFSDRTTGVEYMTGGGSDIITGTKFADIFRVEGGYWDNNHNTFFGGEGNDTFYGGEGSATFVGGIGRDVFVGGYGIETISYQWSAAGVNIARCTNGSSCAATDFNGPPAVSGTQVGGDVALTHVPWILDPGATSNMIVGTCRVWRGQASFKRIGSNQELQQRLTLPSN